MKPENLAAVAKTKAGPAVAAFGRAGRQLPLPAPLLVRLTAWRRRPEAPQCQGPRTHRAAHGAKLHILTAFGPRCWTRTGGWDQRRSVGLVGTDLDSQGLQVEKQTQDTALSTRASGVGAQMVPLDHSSDCHGLCACWACAAPSSCIRDTRLHIAALQFQLLWLNRPGICHSLVDCAPELRELRQRQPPLPSQG